MSAGTACTQSFLIPVQILDLEPSQESVWSSSTGQCRGSKQRQQLVRKSCKGFSTERWFWWQVCDKQFQPSVEWMRQDCFWILSKTLLQLLSWEVFLKNLWRMGGLFFQICLLFKKKVLLRLPEGLHPLFPVNTFTLLFTDTKTEEVWQPMETWSSPALKIYIQYAFEAFPWLQLWKLIISLPLPPNSPITWIFWCLILDKLILPYSLKEHLPLPNCSTFRKTCSSLQSPNAAAEIGSSITRTNNEKHFCFLWESTVTES